MSYWVITASEEAVGPYDDYDSACAAAIEKFGPDGWTVTSI